MSDAWDVFTASLDPAELERERCRVVSILGDERPMGRKHRQMVFEHGRRAARFWRRADSGSWSPGEHVADVVVEATTSVKSTVRESRTVAAVVRESRKAAPVIAADRQLEIALRALEAAETAVGGAVSRSERATGSNASTRSSGVTRASGSNGTTKRKAA